MQDIQIINGIRPQQPKKYMLNNAFNLREDNGNYLIYEANKHESKEKSFTKNNLMLHQDTIMV